jgi:glutaredoxin 3
MTEITIYTKSWCGYCHAAKELLSRQGYRYREIDVTHDLALYREMLARSEGRRTVPQIFIDGKAIGGYTDLSALVRGGKLPPPAARER